MAESCEVIAFRSYFDRLKTGLQSNLYDITPRLFAKELISEDDQTNVLCEGTPSNKGAFQLVTFLLRRIRIDPPSFYQILAELKDFPVLAKGLKGVLKQVQEEAAVQQRLDPPCPTCAPVSLCGYRA